MRSSFLFIVLPFFLVVLITDKNSMTQSSSMNLVKDDAMSCAPGLDENVSTVDGRFMIALPGWGSHHYAISTRIDSAQFYFDQGLNMYYSYHWREANASFKEAARLDPGCAMAFWGQALARGPAYNFAHGYVMPGDIPGVIEKMNALREGAADKEKALIDAMNARYSTDLTDKERRKLNANYSGKMLELVGKYPTDVDITALYVDA